jgi:hypothetical protein
MSGEVVSDDLPRNQRHLWTAIGIVFLFVITCIVLDLLIIDYVAQLEKIGGKNVWIVRLGVLRSVLENLVASALAVLLLGLLYRVVVAWIDPADRVEEVASSQITARLLQNARKSQRYVFIGNTATFVTTAVLPVLADSARAESRVRSISLYVIDPIDAETIDAYRNYIDWVAQQGSKVSDATLAMWVKPSTEITNHEKHEIVGKILAAIYLTAYSVCMQGLSGSVYLRRTFTPFRVDLSDKEAVLTQESASEAAVAFSARGHFYSWYRKECDALQTQCIHLDMTARRDEMRKILVHPLGGKAEVEKAMTELLGLFEHLMPLLKETRALSAAAARISRPFHSYRY